MKVLCHLKQVILNLLSHVLQLQDVTCCHQITVIVIQILIHQADHPQLWFVFTFLFLMSLLPLVIGIDRLLTINSDITPDNDELYTYRFLSVLIYSYYSKMLNGD